MTRPKYTEYQLQMRILTANRGLRARLRSILRRPPSEIEAELRQLRASTRGTARVVAERLFRANLRSEGVKGVPWIDEADDGDGTVGDTYEYPIMDPAELSDDAAYQFAPPSSGIVTTTTSDSRPSTLSSATWGGSVWTNTTPMMSSVGTVSTGTVPRISITQDRWVNHPTPQPTLEQLPDYYLPGGTGWRADPTGISSRYSREKSKGRDGGGLPGRLTVGDHEWGGKTPNAAEIGTVPRSRGRDNERHRLDEEIGYPRRDFSRRGSRETERRSSGQTRRKIPAPSHLESDSDSEGSVAPSPRAHSSRLRVEFCSSGSSSTESEDEPVGSRRRASRRSISPRHRAGRRGSSSGLRHDRINTIKTLKSWGLRFGGDEKESPEQFLARLNSCRRAAGISDEELIPCLAAILVREAGEWFAVHQDEIETGSFRGFERAFRRQFVGEWYDDEVMEELRARYQGYKERIGPFLTKFRRIIMHLKRPPPLHEQVDLAFSRLRPEYKDYLWDKIRDSFDQLERHGREFERREAAKERYRSPPRKEKTRIPGTGYAGPHRPSRGVAAVEETSDEEKEEVAVVAAKPRRKKKGKSVAAPEEVAAVGRTKPPWTGEFKKRVANPYRPEGGAAPLDRTKPPELSSPSAPFTKGREVGPPVNAGGNFVGPCFICQLVGHRAAECPKRECFTCRQIGHVARECPTRVGSPLEKGQGCGAAGQAVPTCPTCRHQWDSQGNEASGTQ